MDGTASRETIARSAGGAVAVALQRSVFLRHFRNRRRFPGIALDPTVNHRIAGRFEYGQRVNIGQDSNIIVPAGAELIVGSDCFFGRNVELGPLKRIEIGGQSSIQDRSILVGDVTIGRYCVISLNVLMTSGIHHFKRWPHLHIRDQDQLVAEDEKLYAMHSRKIFVHEDCWLGMNAVVMPGVSVGRGCVVGANAVVTRDIAPYSVVVGAPARVVGRRMDFAPPSRIDWDEPRHIPYFYDGFALSRDERKKNIEMGGHLAEQGRFAVYLAAGAPGLRLRVRAASGKTATLEHGGIRESVDGEWKECHFPAATDGAAWIATDAPVVVSKAWQD